MGKKSWNVYNQDNIDRVRRDEAEAQAREDEQDRRSQIVDSERRLRLLRGQQIDDLPVEDEPQPITRRKDGHVHSRKRRRLAGEDDTERDMRLAKEETALHSRALDTLQVTDAPLMDVQGHLNLFPSESRPKEKNAEAEAERTKKKREYEDQYTMRFSNAAGTKHGLNAPWYSTISKDNMEEVPGKDVWGNEDIGRRERERLRIDANDPLAAIKRGVKQLRDVEKSRQEWMAERERELQELKELEKPRRSRGNPQRRRRRESIDSDSLDSFDLNNSTKDHKEGRHHRSHSYRHRRESRSARQDIPDKKHNGSGIT